MVVLFAKLGHRGGQRVAGQRDLLTSDGLGDDLPGQLVLDSDRRDRAIASSSSVSGSDRRSPARRDSRSLTGARVTDRSVTGGWLTAQAVTESLTAGRLTG